MFSSHDFQILGKGRANVFCKFSMYPDDTIYFNYAINYFAIYAI